MRFAAAILAGLALTTAAGATDAPSPQAMALAQMVGEAQSREAAALMQVYTLRAEVAALKAEIEAAKPKAEPPPTAEPDSRHP